MNYTIKFFYFRKENARNSPRCITVVGQTAFRHCELFLNRLLKISARLWQTHPWFLIFFFWWKQFKQLTLKSPKKQPRHAESFVSRSATTHWLTGAQPMAHEQWEPKTFFFFLHNVVIEMQKIPLSRPLAQLLLCCSFFPSLGTLALWLTHRCLIPRMHHVYCRRTT